MASQLNYDGGLTCSISVTDFDRSKRWYKEILGFRLLYEMEELGWCEMATEVARVNIGLSQVEKVVGSSGNVVLTFGVKDIAHARREIEEQGVRFDGPIRTIDGVVKLATFYDPDGNAFMFYEDLQQK